MRAFANALGTWSKVVHYDFYHKPRRIVFGYRPDKTIMACCDSGNVDVRACWRSLMGLLPKMDGACCDSGNLDFRACWLIYIMFLGLSMCLVLEVVNYTKSIRLGCHIRVGRSAAPRFCGLALNSHAVTQLPPVWASLSRDARRVCCVAPRRSYFFNTWVGCHATISKSKVWSIYQFPMSQEVSGTLWHQAGKRQSW